MREIKFRGERCSNNEWIYGDAIHVFDWKGNCDDEYGVIEIKPSGKIQREVITETLGQFTGLQDRNGKDIYEGDIVKIKNYYNNVGIVEYTPPDFSIGDGNNGSCSDFNWEEWEEFEIIGNVHDNPERLT